MRKKAAWPESSACFAPALLDVDLCVCVCVCVIIGCTPRESCNRTLLRRVLRRFLDLEGSAS